MIRIEKASNADAGRIAEFQVLMARETENLELDPELVGKGVSMVFEDPGKGFYLVARDEHQVVASLMITYEWSDWRARNVWWIQSLYVIHEYRQQGVFRLMYQWLQERIAGDESIGGIRLYVDNTNDRAHRVYSAIGMAGDHYRVFEQMK